MARRRSHASTTPVLHAVPAKAADGTITQPHKLPISAVICRGGTGRNGSRIVSLSGVGPGRLSQLIPGGSQTARLSPNSS